MKYNAKAIEEAVKEVTNNGVSYRKACTKYGVPIGTLYRHVTNGHLQKQGGQTCLSSELESNLVSKLLTCADWGYPLDGFDLRLFVKSYLDSRHIKLKKFKNNLPGYDWLKSFLIRHKDELANRMVSNIKRARANVSPTIINEFFDNLEQSVEGVPAENIVNYDETNVKDDPGLKKVIVRRGCKYPERVMNNTKTSFSVMFAGSASGALLPIYVVYKADHLWNTWINNGPEGARYNRTATGWFDGPTFQDWFFKIAIPYFRRLEGPKVIIGDNLASHLSIDIINACMQHNIRFVFLPANSTHLCQPLDVAYFAPLKRCWRSILTQWKSGEGRLATSIPKDQLPSLLKSLLNQMEFTGRGAANIIAGFQKTGIQPLDRHTVLNQLPPEQEPSNDSAPPSELSDSLVSFLKNMRYQRPKQKKQIRKKLNVKAGKSITAEEPMSESESSQSQSEESQSVLSHSGESQSVSSLSEDSHTDIAQTNATIEQNYQAEPICPVLGSIKKNDWLLVDFKTEKRGNKKYIGKVLEIYGNSDFTVTFVTGYRNEQTHFVWPDIEDIADIDFDQIARVLPAPTSLRRGVMEFEENRGKW